MNCTRSTGQLHLTTHSKNGLFDISDEEQYLFSLYRLKAYILKSCCFRFSLKGEIFQGTLRCIRLSSLIYLQVFVSSLLLHAVYFDLKVGSLLLIFFSGQHKRMPGMKNVPSWVKRNATTVNVVLRFAVVAFYSFRDPDKILHFVLRLRY